MKDWQTQYLDLKNQMDKYDKLLSRLVLENNQFRSEINALNLQATTLKSEIKTLNLKNEKLSIENIKLKDRLGLNSKNSSIPSSKELYKIKKDQAKKSARKQGAQAGHKPNARDPLVADKLSHLWWQPSSEYICHHIL
jgi:regulator of replication initiation timing